MAASTINRLVVILVVLMLVVISTFVIITQYDLEIINTSSKTDNSETKSSLYAKIFTDKTSGSVPFDVDFDSLVVNNIGDSKYYWDFGDGESDTLADPTHVYSATGVYTVTLTVSNAAGSDARVCGGCITVANEWWQVYLPLVLRGQ